MNWTPDRRGPDSPSMQPARTAAALVLPLALLALALVAVPLRILDAEGLPRYRALRSELTGLRKANATTRQEIRTLKRRVERLRTDPTAIESIARDELGMLREGETLYHFAE